MGRTCHKNNPSPRLPYVINYWTSFLFMFVLFIATVDVICKDENLAWENLHLSTPNLLKFCVCVNPKLGRFLFFLSLGVVRCICYHMLLQTGSFRMTKNRRCSATSADWCSAIGFLHAYPVAAHMTTKLLWNECLAPTPSFIHPFSMHLIYIYIYIHSSCLTGKFANGLLHDLRLPPQPDEWIISAMAMSTQQ